MAGPESSGGRLAARLLQDDATLTVLHRSMPYGSRDDVRFWPDDTDFDGFRPEKVVLTIRYLKPMVASQVAHHGVTAEQAGTNIVEAARRVVAWCGRHEIPVCKLQYERLVQDPDGELATLFGWLGRPARPACEPVFDGNVRWTHV